MEILLYLLTLLASVSVVQTAGANGALNSAFTRGFAGVTTQITSLKFLNAYTNTESFLIACSKGYLGITGYLFLASIVALLLVWVNNLIEFEQAIM
jgi:hypothetical protein